MRGDYQNKMFSVEKSSCAGVTVFLTVLFLIVIFNMFFIPISGQEVGETGLSRQIPVYIADFFEPGCLECEKAARLLEQIAFQYPGVEIQKFDISLRRCYYS